MFQDFRFRVLGGEGGGVSIYLVCNVIVQAMASFFGGCGGTGQFGEEFASVI